MFIQRGQPPPQGPANRAPLLQAAQARHKVFTSRIYPEDQLVISSHILCFCLHPIFVQKDAHRKES